MAKKKPATETAETVGALPSVSPVSGVEGNHYTVLARRYRPQQFHDLVGQEAVAQALTNALQSGRVAHAYLFTGTRGVGKTSAARILAKALNCEKGLTSTPCDQCENCLSIISGDDQDVLEIDGASNNGVDNIRELRQNVQFRPTRSRFKIYIIDEVHMLSTAAFNALLKTLEEPPPHIKFIFATTEIHKVPVTVLSRCQRFDFNGINPGRIHERLQQIVVSENKQADEAALELIARRASGSMRDAQSLLDQLLSFTPRRLTVDSVNELLGTANEERVTALADAVLNKDSKRALQIVSEVMDQGQLLGELLDQLIEYWRDLMVVNCAGIEGQVGSVSSAHRETLHQHATKTRLDTILASMDLLVTAKSRLRYSSHGRTLLEMTLVRLCQLEELMSISEIAQSLNQDSMPTAPQPNTSQDPRAHGRLTQTTMADIEKKKLTPDVMPTSDTSTLPLREENCAQIWQQLLEESGIAIQVELRKVNTLAISGPNTLVLCVSRRYNTPSGSFLDPTRALRVEESLSRITGQTCTIRIEWTEEPVRAEPVAATGKSPAALAMGQQRQLRMEWLQIPFIKQATEVLGAQIVRAEEGFGHATKPSHASTKPVELPEEG